MQAGTLKRHLTALFGAIATLAMPIFVAAADLPAAPGTDPTAILNAFFAGLPGCAAYEFQDVREIKNFPGNRFTVTQLRKAGKHLVRSTRFSEYYFGVNRPGLSKNLIALASYLKGQGLTELAYSDLLSAANARYENARRNREIGECVRMEVPGGAAYLFQPKIEVATLSPEAWDRIADAFTGQANRSLKLSEREFQLIRMKQLTYEELYELRAIKRAVHILQSQTVMKDKKAGGFISNIKGEFTGDGRQNCDSQSKSVQNFLSVLQNRNLIRTIKRFGAIDIPPDVRNLYNDPANSGHSATGMIIPSTGRIAVIDTWFEDGTKPPHIVWEDAWVRFSLWRKNIFVDVVQIAP